MIERYLFLRLKPEFATELGRAELRAHANGLSGLPGLRAVTTGAPADEGARSAWDLSLTLRFDSLAAAEQALAQPAYKVFLAGMLEARAQVIKAWSFEV